MIKLAEEIYSNLSLVTPNVHFSVLPEADASVTHIVYELFESSSYDMMNSNNYANDVELTVKILNPDALELLRLAEKVKDQLLSNPYEYNRDIKYKNSIPTFPHLDLDTLQLTLTFSIYYDSTVIPYTKPIVVERGVTTTLSSGAVYEVIHTPVTITDRFGVVTLKDDGESYTESPVSPVTVTDRKGVATLLGEGEAYVEAAIVPVTIIDRFGVTTTKGEGESYTESPVTKPTVTDRFGVVTELAEGTSYTELPVANPTAIYGTSSKVLAEGTTHTFVHKNSIVTNPNNNTEVSLGYDEHYTVPTFIKPTVTDRFGATTQLAEGTTYVEADVTPVSITDRFGATILKGEGESYTESPITKPVIINLNDNTETELGEGESYTIPLIEDQFDIVLNYPGDADNIITITATEAATYTTEVLTNITSVIYTLNTVAATMPITLAIGDTLIAEIVRTDAALASKITLKNY